MGDPVYPFALPTGAATVGPTSMLTELRIHGVSGPDPAGVLESAAVLHVAGDAITGFARRLGADAYGATEVVDPAQPRRRLEAFSWRGVSSGAGSRALWLLLTPFAFLNVAAWMHPIPPETMPDRTTSRALPRRDPWRDPYVVVLHALLRSMALGFTLLLMLSTLAATEDIPYRSPHVACLGSWSTARCTRVYRISGLTVALASLLLLHLLAKVTWNRYENRSRATDRTAFSTPLEAPRFWGVKHAVSRQEWLHLGASVGLVAWVGLQPSLRTHGRPSVIVLAVALPVVLCVVAWPPWFSMSGDLGAAIPLTQEAADQALAAAGGLPVDNANSGPTSPEDVMGKPARWWAAVRLPLLVVVVVVVFALLSGAVALHGKAAAGPHPHPTVERPGRDVFRIRPALTIILICLTVLMVKVAVVVALMLRRAPANRNHRPMLGGWASALLPPVAFLIAGVLSSAVVLAATKFFDHKAQHVITPGFSELASVGSWAALATVVVAGVFMALRLIWCRACFNPALVTARVADAHDRAAYRNACGTAHVMRSGYAAVPVVTVGGLVWLVATMVVLVSRANPWAAQLPLALFAMAIAVLPGLLLTVYRSIGDRRAVGVIWDVVTFWPRAVHPLAPPCYAERAIPQLIDRVEALAATGPVLVSGHSQGAMISSALFQQLPDDVVGKAGLVTYGCQLSFLFARAFPAYAGGFVLDELALRLGVPDPVAGGDRGATSRWLNLFRLTDLLGSTVHLSTTYADINREVSDPRYASATPMAKPRQSLQAPPGLSAGDLIASMKPLGHSDYPASYEYRAAAEQLDAALGHWRRRVWSD